MSATLALDLGGTKVLCALVEGGRVRERVRIDTERAAGPEAWIATAARAASPWRGAWERAGIAVTGRVHDGLWSPLNPGTLNIPPETPLARLAQEALEVAPVLANDAQAAAWGEHLHGAGRGRDLVYLTISTGVGGGIVTGGRLLTGRGGLGGHVGQMRGAAPDAELVEERISGRWIARAARARGHDADASAVFAAADAGEGWAQELRETAAARAAALCADLQLLLDPAVMVIGGGVGLAPGFLHRIGTHLAALPDTRRPAVVASALGDVAGAVGVAALAEAEGHSSETKPPEEIAT